MQRTLAQLKRQCEKLKLEVQPTVFRKSDGEPKFRKKDYIEALREHFLAESYPEGVPEHLRLMMRIESPMLCYRFNALKPEEQQDIWESDHWVFEEKFDGCRMVLIFVKGEGLFFYSRNISVNDFAPINYTNVLHKTDLKRLSLMFDSFVLDCEVMCSNPNVCRLLATEGIPTETVLQAVSSLLALNDKESLQLQGEGSSLYFKAFDVLMVNGCWDIVDFTYLRRRKGLRQMVSSLESCGFDVTISDIFQGQAVKEAAYQRILDAGGEGVVAKHLGSLYVRTTSRKRDGWVKIKRSMKDSLTAGGFGDTLDGFISGFSLGEAGKGWEDYVGAIHVSIYVRRSDGSRYKHEIARISGLSEELRKNMTETTLNGPCLKDEYYGQVVEIDGQCISARAKRLKHARLIRFREDKYEDLCEIEEEFLHAMIL